MYLDNTTHYRYRCIKTKNQWKEIKTAIKVLDSFMDYVHDSYTGTVHLLHGYLICTMIYMYAYLIQTIFQVKNYGQNRILLCKNIFIVFFLYEAMFSTLGKFSFGGFVCNTLSTIHGAYERTKSICTVHFIVSFIAIFFIFFLDLYHDSLVWLDRSFSIWSGHPLEHMRTCPYHACKKGIDCYSNFQKPKQYTQPGDIVQFSVWSLERID